MCVVVVIVVVEEKNSTNDDLSVLDHQFLLARINQLFMWKELFFHHVQLIQWVVVVVIVVVPVIVVVAMTDMKLILPYISINCDSVKELD